MQQNNIERISKNNLFPHFIILISAVVFWFKLVFSGKTLFFDLTTRSYYPIASLFSYSWKNLEVPLWNPYVYCGMPFLANPQTAVLYPFSYIFLIFSYPTALNIFIIIHTAIAGMFMYKLSREFGMSDYGSIISAFIFMFNGFFVLHAGMTSQIAAYVWLPGVLYYFKKYTTEQLPLYAVFTAITLTLQFFAGYPGFVYYTILFLLVYHLVFLEQHYTYFESLKKLALAFVSVGVITLLFSSAQLLPSIELAANSSRGSGLDRALSSVYSISTLDYCRFLLVPLWDYFQPFYKGDVHIIGYYFGLVSIGVCLFNYKNIRKKEHFFLISALVLLTGLAIGSGTPLYNIFLLIVPGWKYFRFPAQVMYLFAFCFALLTGYMLDMLRSNYVRIILVILVFTELFLFNLRANRLIDKSYYETTTPSVGFLQKDNSLFRIMLTPKTVAEPPYYDADYYKRWLNFKDMLYPNTASAYRLSYADGYETMMQSSALVLFSNIKDPSSKILDIMNLKYMFSKRELGEHNMKLVKDGYVKIYENIHCLPRFYMANKAELLRRDKIIDAMLDKGFDPTKTVFIEDTMPFNVQNSFQLQFAGQDKVSIEQYTMNKYKLNTYSKDAKWLFCGEAYYPGWKAEVDGLPVKIYRTDYYFRAIFLPPGAHKVLFYYAPMSFILGLLISSLSAIAFLILLFKNNLFIKWQTI